VTVLQDLNQAARYAHEMVAGQERGGISTLTGSSTTAVVTSELSTISASFERVHAGAHEVAPDVTEVPLAPGVDPEEDAKLLVAGVELGHQHRGRRIRQHAPGPLHRPQQDSSRTCPGIVSVVDPDDEVAPTQAVPREVDERVREDLRAGNEDVPSVAGTDVDRAEADVSHDSGMARASMRSAKVRLTQEDAGPGSRRRKAKPSMTAISHGREERATRRTCMTSGMVKAHCTTRPPWRSEPRGDDGGAREAAGRTVPAS
jgi:hypothetical protein